VETDYKRNVGAQIGIHDWSWRKVGRVSHLRNEEYLFVVGVGGTPQPSALSDVGGTAPAGAWTPRHAGPVASVPERVASAEA
jgi:adenine-specific DNA-methyltransferase